MREKSVFGMLVCLLLLATNAWALTPVLDTGGPRERVCNPRSYKNLGGGIVRDNVTGLMWQKDTAPGIYTWDQALDYCNKLELGDFSDWRLPTIEELSTLVHSGRCEPAIDSVFSAPKTHMPFYWSYNEDALFFQGAVEFSYGIVMPIGASQPSYVRAVRGDHYRTYDNIVINGDGTVTAPNTGLVWQQCDYGQSWNGAECAGNADILTWQQAADYVKGLNKNNYLGYSDWRLPTKNELQSIVDYNSDNPEQNSSSKSYWSSTKFALGKLDKWFVALSLGMVGPANEGQGLYVRVVRGGTCKLRGSDSIDKCSVKAGKINGADSIKFSGFLNAAQDDFIYAMGDSVVVAIDADEIPDLNNTTFDFPVEEDYLKKGKYKSPKVKPEDKSDSVTQLQIDITKGKMKFSGKNLDLTGLSCPITITIQIGDYVAEEVLYEDIVNGPKKPCPPELMR